MKLTAAPASAWHWSKPNWLEQVALVWNVASGGGGRFEETDTPRCVVAVEPARLMVSRTE